MGLEDSDLLANGGSKAALSISCSICLEDVTDYGDRAWAKLQCGHQFHLDCIGSAFNVKGVMQCPNCRKVEKGQWLYSDGCKPNPELNIDDLVHDADIYDLSYSETSIWCPFDGFTRFAAAAAFDEVDFPTIGYNEIVGQHSEQHSATVTSTTHICPYIAYVHPSASTANVGDGNRYNNNQWNNNSQPTSTEIPNSYGYVDHYHTHVDHPSIMPTRTNVDLPTSGSYVHNSFLADQSSTRGPSSISSSMNHPYLGSAARARERSQAFQAYFQQPTTMRAPGSHRSNSQLQLGSASDQPHGAGVYNPSSSRSFQEAENSVLNPFHHIWERDPPHPYPHERAPFHQTGTGSGSGSGSGRYRHGSERTPSQISYWL